LATLGIQEGTYDTVGHPTWEVRLTKIVDQNPRSGIRFMNEIPEELLLRLSAYMDGDCDEDERAAIENELARNSSARTALQALENQQRLLRDLANQTMKNSLPANFPDRLVDLAIERAASEGLSENHPLVLAGSSPSLAQSYVRPADRTPHRSSRRVITAAISVAASIMLMGWLGWSWMDGENNSETKRLAGISSLPANSSSDPIVNQAEIAQLESSLPIENSIASDNTSDKVAAKDDSTAKVAPVEMASLPTTMPTPAADTGSVANVEPKTDSEPNVSVPLNGMLLVVEVHCVEGVSQDALIQQAMEWAGIQENSKHEITDEIASVAADKVKSNESFQVIYLSAPARQLDRMYLRLVSDSANVKTVGLAIATDAPILDLSESIQKQPTNIRDTAVAIQVANLDPNSTLADKIESLTFLPITDGPVSLGSGGDAPSGDDEMAQMLFIVR
jgi:hypothetical protein